MRGDVTILNALALRACALAGMGPVLLANWLIDEDIKEGRLVDLFRIIASPRPTSIPPSGFYSRAGRTCRTKCVS